MPKSFLGIAFLALGFILAFSMNSHAQNGKSTLQFKITPTIAETFYSSSLNDYFDRNSALIFRQLYSLQKPTKAIRAYELSLEYRRTIVNNYFIGISYSAALKGQRSPLIFAIDGRDISDYSPNYGGTAYDLKYRSNMLGLVFGRHFQPNMKSKFTFSIFSKLGADIFRLITLQNYILEKDSGILSRGCCSSTYRFGNNNIFEIMGQGYFGLFTSVGIDLNIPISKWLDLSLGSQAGMSFPSVKKDQSFPVVFYGTSTWAGLSAAVNLKF